MATLTKSVLIDAPIEKVFAYLENPMNMLDVWPSMVDIRNIQSTDGGLKTYEWTYKMAGMKLDGSSVDVESVPYERMVTVSKGGIESTITWLFSAEDGKTRLTSITEYSVPMPVLGKLAESIILKTNDREAETLLVNIKTMLEQPEPVQ